MFGLNSLLRGEQVVNSAHDDTIIGPKKQYDNTHKMASFTRNSILVYFGFAHSNIDAQVQKSPEVQKSVKIGI